MRLTDTPIPGAFLVDVDALLDERGFFARTVCRDEFARRGASTDFVQQSISFNHRSGTVRGLHYQAIPREEEKLVRVTRGAIFDVIADIRTGSPMRGTWFGVTLSAENRRALYVPKGVAHGFQTISDNTEVFYQMTTPFDQEATRGIRWNDRTLAIQWPEVSRVILSGRDRALPEWAG